VLPLEQVGTLLDGQGGAGVGVDDGAAHPLGTALYWYIRPTSELGVKLESVLMDRAPSQCQSPSGLYWKTWKVCAKGGMAPAMTAAHFLMASVSDIEDGKLVKR
jgi:hypothetical protein